MSPPDESRSTVGARLRSVREFYGLGQPEFARQVGIQRDRLASYERDRVKLSAPVGLKICRHYVVNEQWLATGMTWHSRTFESRFGSLETRQCFSYEAYPQGEALPARMTLLAAIQGPLATIDELGPRQLPIDPLDDIRFRVRASDPPELFANFMRYQADLWMSELSGARLMGFFQFVFAQAAVAFEDAKMLDQDFIRENEYVESGNTKFDNPREVQLYLTKAMLDNLPRNTDELRERLERALSDRGARSALARHFGVSRQAVNGWLSGDSNPSPNLTISLLHWVMESEAAQKSRRPAQTERRRKTRPVPDENKVQPNQPKGSVRGNRRATK